MKIVFISLYDKIALGLRSLSSYLKARGHSTHLIYFKNYRQVKLDRIKGPLSSELHIQIKDDGRYALGYPETPREEEYRLLEKLLKQIQPDLIGLSLTSLHREAAIYLSREIRKNFSVPIIWGGAYPTVEPLSSLNHADMVLRGEGEEAMLELVNRLEVKADLTNIPNVWLRRDGHIIQNPVRPLIKDLDSLPFSDTSPRHKYALDKDRILENDPALSNDSFREKYEIMTNRGCPYRCTYCINHQLRELYKGSPYLRQRSVSHTVAELMEVKQKRAIDFIEFQDDIFPWREDWVKEFSSIYKEKIGLSFCCYLYPSHVESSVLKALKDSGLHHVVMGIQSGSERILYDVFHRPTPRLMIMEAIKKLKQQNIFTYFDVITDNPFEEDGDRYDTLTLLLNTRRPFGLNLSGLSLFPGTEIFRMAGRKREGGGREENSSRFWASLYLLSNKRYFSGWLIFLFSRLKFLRHKPQGLEFILRLYCRFKNMARTML